MGNRSGRREAREIRLNVRTTEEIKRDIETTARLRGLTVSSLVNLLAVQAIREEKKLEPRAFERAAGSPGRKASGAACSRVRRRGQQQAA
jgi:hypothetical protein